MAADFDLQGLPVAGHVWILWRRQLADHELASVLHWAARLHIAHAAAGNLALTGEPDRMPAQLAALLRLLEELAGDADVWVSAPPRLRAGGPGSDVRAGVASLARGSRREALGDGGIWPPAA